MRRISAIAIATATALFVVELSAQAPNLSGTWVRVDDPASQVAGGGGRGRGGRGGGGVGFSCGMECTITQDAKMLTVTTMQGGNQVKRTFNLDGSPSTNQVMMGRGGEAQAMDVVSTAKVSDSTIVISTPREMRGMTMTPTQTLSLEGGNLVVVTSSGREGATPQKVVYKKKG